MTDYVLVVEISLFKSYHFRELFLDQFFNFYERLAVYSGYYCFERPLVVRYDMIQIIAIVDRGLEHLHALFGNLGAAQPADARGPG